MNNSELKIIGLFGEYNDNGKLMPAAQLAPHEDFKFDAHSVAALCVCTFNAFEVYVSKDEKEGFKNRFVNALGLMLEHKEQYSQVIKLNES